MAIPPAQQAVQSTVDPYAPAPNLIRVERIKDVNSGQDVFIRWVTETNSSSAVNEEQQLSVPYQAYSTHPPKHSTTNYRYPLEEEFPDEIERLALEDEHLRKSLLFDDRPPSMASTYKHKKHKKREKHRSFDNQKVSYEVVNGYFEDRHGKKRPVKLDRAHINNVKDYRHLYNEIVNSSAPQKDRRHSHRATSVIHPPISEQQQQQQQPFPISTYPLVNQPLIRPYGTPFLPRSTPFYPQPTFNTKPLFPQPNFMNGSPLVRPPFWYRPM
jgi:hypothetical protein